MITQNTMTETDLTEISVLVIDDELVICQLLNDLLSDKGYTVQYVFSGKEGIEKARTGKYDVIILDIKIPDIDGTEVLKKIKDSTPESIVVMHTGYPSFETIRQSLKFGAFDYITKPCEIEEILFVMKRAVAFGNLATKNKRLLGELQAQNGHLEEKVMERTKELRSIYSLGRDILSSLDLDTVLKTIVDKVNYTLKTEICSILFLNNDDTLTIKHSSGLSQEIIEQTKLKTGEMVSGWVAQNKQSILVADIKTDPRLKDIEKEKYLSDSFVSVPLIANKKVIGVLNVCAKKTKDIFTKHDLRFISGVANEASIALENALLYSSLQKTYIRTINSLTSAIDCKDHYTKKHSENVTVYAVAIAKEMGLPEEEIERISRASQLHDIGKIGIHDYILTKPGELTPLEWKEMKLHSIKGAEILRPLLFLGDVINLVEQHHERYDGEGYPYHLKGKNIELGARIMAVADSFDAMVSERPYRNSFLVKEAMEELKNCAGSQFDPNVVETFLRVLKKIPGVERDKKHALHNLKKLLPVI